MVRSRGMAVIGAFLLIALAIFVRGKLVDDGDGSGGSKGPKQGDGPAPVVACTPDLDAVCDALASEGDIRPYQVRNGSGDLVTTSLELDQAADPPKDLDGWITWNPAPEIANFLSSPTRTPRVWATTEVLGSAPEVVLADGDSATNLAARCKAKTSWACLGGLAPELSIGVGDPATAEGIARLAPFAQAYAKDDDLVTLDAEALDAIVRSPTGSQADATEMAQLLATQVGSLSMVAGPDRLLEQQTRTAAGRRRNLKVVESFPSSELTVVLAARVGREDDLRDLSCKGLPAEAASALTTVGLAPCTGSADDALAGFLFQVRKKVG